MQYDRTIVMLSGWAGAGKDAVANLMCEEMGYTRLAFADIVRQEVSEKTHIPIQYFALAVYKDSPLQTPLKDFPSAITYRDVLIQWASARRATQNDVYAQQIIDIIRSGDVGGKFVISDWRFLCEETAITDAFPGARIIRIRIQRDSVVPLDTPSEHELDNYPMDAILHNNGTISDLRATLHRFPVLQMNRVLRNNLILANSIS